MSDVTKIEWATSTGNPWIGCTKVSPGCKNCYAETLDKQRFSRTMGGGTREKPISHWGPGAPRVRTKGFWKDAVRWNAEHEKWKNQPCDPKFRPAVDAHPNPRIFPSLCDWLDDEVPIEWLADFLKLIHDTPSLDWLLLTKRPELFEKRLREAARHIEFLPVGTDKFGTIMANWVVDWYGCARKAPQNVWIGVSVEDQQRADERIPKLLKIPAVIRFLSIEPLLGPVDLNAVRFHKLGGGTGPETVLKDTISEHARNQYPVLNDIRLPVINWVIIGGESGPDSRPCNVEWIRSIVAQCKSANVPCFVKQLGANVCNTFVDTGEQTDRIILKHPKGGDMAEWPEDLRVRQFPKTYELDHTRAG